jgi:hypothetical protein
VCALKKPLTGGEEIPKSVRWVKFPLSRMLKATFTGAAFTSSIFCVSQHPMNGGQTFYTIDFGEHFSKLRSNVTRGKDKSISNLIKTHQKQIDQLKSDISTQPQKDDRKEHWIIWRNECIEILKVFV